jgi:hypothetical protein
MQTSIGISWGAMVVFPVAFLVLIGLGAAVFALVRRGNLFVPLFALALGLLGAILLLSLVSVRHARMAGSQEATVVPMTPKFDSLQASPQIAEIQVESMDPGNLKPVGAVDETSPHQAVASEPKPEWLEKRGRYPGVGYRVAVKSGPYVTEGECRRSLEVAVRGAVAEYLDSYLGEGTSALLTIQPQYVRDEIQRDEFHETVQASIGTMQQIHSLLVFDDGVRQHLQEAWREALISRRLWLVGGGAGAVLTLLAAAFGYLRLSGAPSAPSPEPAAASPAAPPPVRTAVAVAPLLAALTLFGVVMAVFALL